MGNIILVKIEKINKDMDCKKCEKRIVLHAFSEGFCKICDAHVSTSSIPCNIICNHCCETHNLCEHCGKTLENNE